MEECGGTCFSCQLSAATPMNERGAGAVVPCSSCGASVSALCLARQLGLAVSADLDGPCPVAAEEGRDFAVLRRLLFLLHASRAASLRCEACAASSPRPGKKRRGEELSESKKAKVAEALSRDLRALADSQPRKAAATQPPPAASTSSSSQRPQLQKPSPQLQKPSPQPRQPRPPIQQEPKSLLIFLSNLPCEQPPKSSSQQALDKETVDGLLRVVGLEDRREVGVARLSRNTVRLELRSALAYRHVLSHAASLKGSSFAGVFVRPHCSPENRRERAVWREWGRLERAEGRRPQSAVLFDSSKGAFRHLRLHPSTGRPDWKADFPVPEEGLAAAAQSLKARRQPPSSAPTPQPAAQVPPPILPCEPDEVPPSSTPKSKSRGLRWKSVRSFLSPLSSPAVFHSFTSRKSSDDDIL